MKRIGTLFLAAVLGSICTVATFHLTNRQGGANEVVMNYTNSVPLSKIAYAVDEDGKTVPLDFTVAAEKVMPAVVHIRSTYTGSQRPYYELPEAFRDFFGPMLPRGPRESQSAGSGVIINSEGYIVTNNHVVREADEIQVALYDNRIYTARLVGADPDTDLAVIKIDEDEDLSYLSFVDSNEAKVGEWVLAVGNPFNLTSTVTAGIISAKGRNINILSRPTEQGSTAIESFIQTDAAINPGNSGGALVDLNGGLVGINTAIASPTGAYSGYGFAVPSNIVSKVVEDLIEYGVVQRGWLGVSITSVNRQLAEEEDLKVTSGAYVSGFANNSSAREAGLKEGDVVVRIDDRPIRSNTELIEYIGTLRPGDKVTMIVNRDGKEVTIPVVLKTRDGRVGPVRREVVADVDLALENLDEKKLEELGLEHGVLVNSIGSGKLARYTDIRPGFIITRVNDKPVKSVDEFNKIFGSIRSGELVILSGTYQNNPRAEYNYAFRK